MQLNTTNINARSECSISCSLDIIGDKWTLLIIRDAMFLGKTAFNEFRQSPEKIASNILTNRMEKLVRCGIMTKNKNPENKLKYDYELTKSGLALKPVLMTLGAWGSSNINGTNNLEEQLKDYNQK